MAGDHVPATPPLQAGLLLPAVASSGRQWSSVTLGFLFWKMLVLRITRGPATLWRSWPHACIISRVDPAQPPTRPVLRAAGLSHQPLPSVTGHAHHLSLENPGPDPAEGVHLRFPQEASGPHLGLC